MEKFKQPQREAVNEIHEARNERDHGNLNYFVADRVAQLLKSLQDILDKLGLDPGPLPQLRLTTIGSSIVAGSEPPQLERSRSGRAALGGMLRLGFRDPLGERGKPSG